MNHSISEIIERNRHKRALWVPEILDIAKPDARSRFEALLAGDAHLSIFDEIQGQLTELVKLRNPTQRIDSKQSAELIREHTGGRDLAEYGVWVYYPWNGNLVHILPRKEFIEVRTNRNRHKITADEQATLAGKTIGVVGMSVGSSVAVTIAMERICSEIRIADFDTLELSNYNRIRTDVANLGLSKAVAVAREIAAIDPFIRVVPFSEGLTTSNIGEFIRGIDVLVDECDDMGMKLTCRYHARKAGIPVLMETSDRGMLDIELFNLEPERKVFHGLLQKEYTSEELGKMTPAERFGLTMSIVQHGQLSDRAKMSIAEIGKSITTWPQLASAIMLGAGTCTDLCRKILLGQFTKSGRYYVDLNEIVQ